MDALNHRQEDCPRGTKFFDCADNLFTGCCSVDPCNLSTCPDGQGTEKEGNDKTTKTAASPTSRLEVTVSSSVNIPVISTSSVEISEAVSSDGPTSIVITVTPTTDSESIAAPTTTENEAASTESKALVSPDATSTKDGIGGIATATASSTASSTDAATGDTDTGTGGLPIQQVVGICVAIGSVVVIAAFILFWLNRRRRRVTNAIGFGDRTFSGYELQPYALASTVSTSDPFGNGSEGQFTRASAYRRPVSRRGPPNGSLPGQSGEPRMPDVVVTAPPKAMTTPASPTDSQPVVSSADTSQGESTRFDFSRADVSTPEIQGSPSFAQVATFRGLPRIVEIPSTRRDFQRTYVPYRPGAEASRSGGVGAGAHGIRANLNLTEEERSMQQHVTSWAQYENGRRD